MQVRAALGLLFALESGALRHSRRVSLTRTQNAS